MILYFHPEARCLSLLYSTATPTHGICPCGTRLSPRDGKCPCGTQLSTRDTGPVSVVLYCTNVTQIHCNSPCATLLSPRYTIPVPVVLYCHPETWCLSLWFSTVTHRHGTLLYFHTKTRHDICPCGVLLSHKDMAPVPAVFYLTQRHGASPCDITQRHGASPCGVLLSYKDTVPVPVVLYCHTKTRYLSL